MPLTNAWTGGQYSLFRGLFGLYLLQHFLFLLPWGAGMFSSRDALSGAGAVLSTLFLVGKWDRSAALAVLCVWVYSLGSTKPMAIASLSYVGWMLVAHACLPAAPFGSWAARGRLDPDGGWRFPPAVYLAGWIVLALGYGYSGYTKLASQSWMDGSAELATWGVVALELSFAPLAVILRLRPWIWSAMLLLLLGRLAALDVADATASLVFLHLWTFDPAWVPARRAATPETLFYDGECGLCHRWVRFVLAEDARGGALQFAPLQGQTFARQFSEDARPSRPDTVAVRTADGRLLTRSNAARHVLASLGGYWRIIGAVMGLAPRGLRDAVYDGIASVRHRLFARPPDMCPRLPPDLRARFLE